jgi:hypothetical protein
LARLREVGLLMPGGKGERLATTPALEQAARDEDQRREEALDAARAAHAERMKKARAAQRDPHSVQVTETRTGPRAGQSDTGVRVTQIPRAGHTDPPTNSLPTHRPQRPSTSSSKKTPKRASSSAVELVLAADVEPRPTEEEAKEIISRFKKRAADRGKPITTINGYVRTVVDSGDLPDHIQAARDERETERREQEAMRRRAEIQRARYEAGRAPNCEHGCAGGDLIDPGTDWPYCEICRIEAGGPMFVGGGL